MNLSWNRSQQANAFIERMESFSSGEALMTKFSKILKNDWKSNNQTPFSGAEIGISPRC